MYIASASSVVKFHDYPNNQLIHTYSPTYKVDGPCRSLSWSKDGCWLAVVPYSGPTEIVTLKGQCKLLHTVSNVSEPSCASFQNSTKRNIAVGTKNGQVLLYDIKLKHIKSRYPRTSSPVTHVGFTAKDTHCYAGCANGEILLYNHVTKSQTASLQVPQSKSLTTVKAHVQIRNYLIAGSNEGIICVWDFNANKVKFQTQAHNAPISSAIFSPINSALIVSAGLDRVVNVFDIDGKCSRISSIPVENNILSVDFLEGSLYIAMGAQNGNIYIYDTRKLPNPVCSYPAHQSAIKHLTYQYSLNETVSTDTSTCNVAEEVSNKTIEKEIVKNKRTSDLFGLMDEGPASVSEYLETPLQESAAESGDSFMMKLNLSKSDAVESFKNCNEEPDSLSLKIQPFSNVTPNLQRIVQEKALFPHSSNVIHKNSTPIVPDFNVSPLMNNKDDPIMNIEDLHATTKDIIKSEIRKNLDEMETRFSYHLMTHSGQQRRMLLDLHLATVKEFIKIENLIRDEIRVENGGNRQENILIEENRFLRRRVEELEKQIANIHNTYELRQEQNTD